MSEEINKTIPVETRGEYKIINPKKHLSPGESIVITIINPEVREVEGLYGSSGVTTVGYNGEEVSLWFRAREIPFFKQAYDKPGDKVRLKAIPALSPTKKPLPGKVWLRYERV